MGCLGCWIAECGWDACEKQREHAANRAANPAENERMGEF